MTYVEPIAACLRVWRLLAGLVQCCGWRGEGVCRAKGCQLCVHFPLMDGVWSPCVRGIVKCSTGLYCFVALERRMISREPRRDRLRHHLVCLHHARRVEGRREAQVLVVGAADGHVPARRSLRTTQVCVFE